MTHDWFEKGRPMASSLCLGRRWLLLLGAIAAVAGCSGDTMGGEFQTQGGAGGAGCPPGSEGCPCYGNSTCNQPLTCASPLCVQLGTGGTVGLGGSGFYVSRGGAPGVGGVSTGGAGIAATGGTSQWVLGGFPAVSGGFRAVLGGFPAFTGGMPGTGGLGVGGSNNPAGCPATQPANRTNCTEGTGPCAYGTQLCQCGQFYSNEYQWTCGNAPPATGGTGAGGRSTGGRATGGAGGTAGNAGATAGTPAAGGSAPTGGMAGAGV